MDKKEYEDLTISEAIIIGLNELLSYVKGETQADFSIYKNGKIKSYGMKYIYKIDDNED